MGTVLLIYGIVSTPTLLLNVFSRLRLWSLRSDAGENGDKAFRRGGVVGLTDQIIKVHAEEVRWMEIQRWTYYAFWVETILTSLVLTAMGEA